MRQIQMSERSQSFIVIGQGKESQDQGKIPFLRAEDALSDIIGTRDRSRHGEYIVYLLMQLV